MAGVEILRCCLLSVLHMSFKFVPESGILGRHGKATRMKIQTSRSPMRMLAMKLPDTFD
jgi:hypothetical protein